MADTRHHITADAAGSEMDTARWLGFWGALLGLALLAIIGAMFASHGEEPGDYQCGMLLAIGAIVLAFLRVKSFFDETPGGWGTFLFVETWTSLAFIIPIFVVLGLAGLFVAHAWESGSLHAAGIALFLASGGFVFLSLKRVFDRADSARH